MNKNIWISANNAAIIVFKGALLIFERAMKNPKESSAYLGIELKVPVRVGRIRTAIE